MRLDEPSTRSGRVGSMALLTVSCRFFFSLTKFDRSSGQESDRGLKTSDAQPNWRSMLLIIFTSDNFNHMQHQERSLAGGFNLLLTYQPRTREIFNEPSIKTSTGRVLTDLLKTN